MELTREALSGLRLRRRGQWYHACQVDRFLEELVVAVDQAQREGEKLRARCRDLENRPAPNPGSLPESQQLQRQRQICAELREERDQLIADIKALRQFRSVFRETVEQEAQGLLEQLEELPSEKLL